METNYQSFVVKILDGGRKQLRGYIERVTTQERAYFEGLPAMNRFITQHLKPSVEEPPIEKKP